MSPILEDTCSRYRVQQISVVIKVLLQCDGQLVTVGGWMMDTLAMERHGVVPRQPVAVNNATTSETLQLWHEHLGYQYKRHVRKVLERMEINISMAETEAFCDGCVLGKHIGSLSLHGWINHRSSVSWSMLMLMGQCQWSHFEVQRAMYFSMLNTARITGFSSSSKRKKFPTVYTCVSMKCRLLVTE